ncbi:hypothetical protein KFE25_000348 [Diacronema lutheri]|uniref:Uncharacterized protein n=2 Tax=Diacronema lutheri TaxID=2081491 RepID=A0A8J6C9Y7_DIALT|nr:hypothetical protein KFE25_000348 [Diacronema lutheri]
MTTMPWRARAGRVAAPLALLLVACAEGVTVLGVEGQTCAMACANVSMACDAGAINAIVNQGLGNTAIGNLANCSSWAGLGTAAAPSHNLTTGECFYISTTGFSTVPTVCAEPPNDGEVRVCVCEPFSPTPPPSPPSSPPPVKLTLTRGCICPPSGDETRRVSARHKKYRRLLFGGVYSLPPCPPSQCV